MTRVSPRLRAVWIPKNIGWLMVFGWLWFGNYSLGIVLATAMILNIVIAGLAGILIPLGLNRIGIDPALASTVFLTTITDVVGFFSFLGLAAWFLV